ncbi:lipid A ethanolaminephosphotransferase [Pseudidiomarina maritima]|uniref:Lipid A ethanolaminephosphotransferase n=1 Tax=Pseudidiomarina maritima TaxID=519453 RepID=A0A1I6HK15_9GAMM|nr:phosphoethanolamine--lipid A transferase [Pseudidiomarina maritima]SFR54657.1 lipid A ethanolaminephosphotransferase [Pseudidiomarina maritima]
MKRINVNFPAVLLGVTAWLVLAYSVALRDALESYAVYPITQVKLFVFVACVYGIMLVLARMLNIFKPVAISLILLAAPAAFYMQQYGILIDPDMLINALETDPAEANDQLSAGLFMHFIFMGIMPALILIFLKITPTSIFKRLKQGVVIGLCFTTFSVGIVMTSYDDFASLFRNHRDIKYRIVPFNVISASVSVAKQKLRRPAEFVAQGKDAFREISAETKPKVMVVILGETARADHFSVNGYPRPTTPRLEQLERTGEIASYDEAVSCGTATAISVPCMFSFYNADNYDQAARNTTNVLDVLDTVGIKVTWVENNSGCKNVCDRINTITMPENACTQNDCFDTVLIDKFREWLQQVQGDSVLVLHQMGSHGPAYFERSPNELKRFLPECTSAELTDCAREEIVNAYDNSLVVTDEMVAAIIELLKTDTRLDASLMYVSDHGESLGDNGVYLHGLPKWLAPKEQTHIPWIVWPSTRFKADAQKDNQQVSHDNLSHTLLGYFKVKTRLYDRQLDLIAERDSFMN